MTKLFNGSSPCRDNESLKYLRAGGIVVAFRFSLASVLRVRESIERREELALQKAEQELARVRWRIDELTGEIAKAVDAREKALQQAIQAHRLQSMDAEINAAGEAKQTLLETLQTLQQQRDAQMKLYQAAYNGRRMLTDLSEQQKTEFEQEQDRAQQKRLDDIFASRWQRN
jgi:flagellar FliJ protein